MYLGYTRLPNFLRNIRKISENGRKLEITFTPFRNFLWNLRQSSAMKWRMIVARLKRRSFLAFIFITKSSIISEKIFVNYQKHQKNLGNLFEKRLKLSKIFSQSSIFPWHKRHYFKRV